MPAYGLDAWRCGRLECRLELGIWWALYMCELACMSCYPVPKGCRGRPAEAIEQKDPERCRYQASRLAPDRDRGSPGLPMHPGRAGIDLKPLVKKAGLTDACRDQASDLWIYPKRGLWIANESAVLAATGH
jgi:hypothetical protein